MYIIQGTAALFYIYIMQKQFHDLNLYSISAFASDIAIIYIFKICIMSIM